MEEEALAAKEGIVSRFLRFVEIQTKIASVTPYLTGLTYALWTQRKVNGKSALVFLAAMLLFDMGTTAINNYIDARVAGTRAHFSNAVSLAIIGVFVGVSAALGIYLTVLHGIVVLVCGVICFSIGVFYTFGPAPISRTPYGELFSGGIMGFFITFLSYYINAPAGSVIAVDALYPSLVMKADVVNVVKIGFVSLPLILGIANIMLANNICDVERDVKISRFTLPYYIGNKNALRLFAVLYYAAFLTIAVLAIVRVIPLFCLASLVSFIPIRKNIRLFQEKQIKSETFPLSGLNLILLTTPYCLFIFLGFFVGW